MPIDDPRPTASEDFDSHENAHFRRRQRKVNLLPLAVVCALVLGSGTLIVWAVSQSGNRTVEAIAGQATPDPSSRSQLSPDQARALQNPPVGPVPAGLPARGGKGAAFDSSRPVRPAVAVIAGSEPPPVSAVADASNSAPLNFDPDDPSNAAVRAEVLERIDLMPGVSAANKDKLYGRVDHARGMGRVLTVPFEKGEAAVRASTVDKLRTQLADPRFKQLLDDPTVVFVVLGYADQKGNDKVNAEISLTRARSVVDAMRDKCALLNVMHPVAMGGSNLFSAKEADKNRVVEIWAVVP